MKLLITGICGFAGSTLGRPFREHFADWSISGVDNLSRPGSEINRSRLQALSISVIHGDLRNACDLETLLDVDWIVDAAANPSIFAGLNGKSDSRQVIENNLSGTVNLLQHCRKRRCGFILLSTSRVYSIHVLSSLPLRVHKEAFCLAASDRFPAGVSPEGLDESFPTTPPVSCTAAQN
jgi:CDP-paratose 2-epimerase